MKQIELLSSMLFDCFVVNQRYHAVQKQGVYIAKKQFINIATIERMINSEESFMCYQEDFNLIKWICFDFDISKSFVDSPEFKKQKEQLFKDLIKEVKPLIEFLKSININYLIEFSGNRGVHVWILFDEKITRQEGFLILQAIIDKSCALENFDKVVLDKYPKSYRSISGTDKGTGVKIPLSKHKKSNRYALLVKSIDDLVFNDINVDKLNNNIIQNQIDLLKQSKNNKEDLFSILQINVQEQKKQNERLLLNSTSTYINNQSIAEIKTQLSKCQHLQKILEKDNPNEKERQILVGCFGQLHCQAPNISTNLN